MLWHNLSADNKYPQLKKQTTTPRSLATLLFPRSLWVLLSPLTERWRDWANALTSLSEKKEKKNYLIINPLSYYFT